MCFCGGGPTIMREAGLTHGGFYVHFASRRHLVEEMPRRASEEGRTWYFRGLAGRAGLDWVVAAVRRYLTARHRDTPEAGCPVAALSGDLAREDAGLRRVFEDELGKIVGEFRRHLAEAGEPDVEDRALALVALCAGGISLARAVSDRRLSDRILRACQRLAERDVKGANT
jgi:TetR/AcrR family transcriptional repressor of nem operon